MRKQYRDDPEALRRIAMTERDAERLATLIPTLPTIDSPRQPRRV